MKKIVTLAILCLFNSTSFASEFSDSVSTFATKLKNTSTNLSRELESTNGSESSTDFYSNEIVVKLQPELGASVPGVSSLKFAFNVEYVLTRPLPQNLEVDKP